ncbi:MAG: xanthine dehydrogenase family protein molybdopterin-binding subunit, partial [Nitrososphaerales archaeon]
MLHLWTGYSVASTSLGKPLRCREDLHLVRGQGTFADDISSKNSCYVSFFRSSQAHAKIKRVGISRVKSIPGVLDVITCAELKQLIKPIVESPFTLIPGKPPVKPDVYYGLADQKVTYVGEPIVAILASSRYIGEDALDAIEFEYEPLQVISDPILATQEGVPELYGNWKNNILCDLRIDEGEADSILKNAPKVIHRKFSIQRQTIASIEPRCSTAMYDDGTGVLTVWSSTQTPHVERSNLARTLRMPENRIRVIAKDVGGAFGLKTTMFAETVIASLFALRTRKTAKWTETRSESIATFQAREQLHDVVVGVDLAGKILALKDRVIANHGAYYPTGGAKSILNTALFLPGCYKIRDYSANLTCVVSNKGPYTAYRGFGKKEASYVVERVIDAIGKELGIDPAVVRFRNFIRKDEFPYTSATGCRYDSGDYEKCLGMLLEAIRYDERRKEQAREREHGNLMGIGLSISLAPGGSANPDSLLSGYEAAHIRIAPDGSITVFSGVSSQGQSHETVISQAVADQIGVDESRIRVVEGDTDLCPYGLGAWSDRTSVKGIPAAIKAAKLLRQKLGLIASAFLNVPTESVVFNDGRIFSKNEETSNSMDFADLVWRVYTKPYLLPASVDPGLEAIAYVSTNNVRYLPDEKGNFSLYPTFGYCACGVTLFVDPESGLIRFDDFALVDDSGRVGNPLVVEAQLQGGAAQGFGSMMLEEVLYDIDGQLLNSSFMDYLIPSATFSPNPRIGHLETPSPFVTGGFKS